MITLHNDEQKQAVFRRHPIVMLLPLATSILLGSLPFVFYYTVPFSSPFAIEGDAASLLTFFIFGWVLILWLAFSIAFIDYWLDIWIVTDKRLLDFEQQGIFYREVAVADLEDIEDITIEVKGIFATLLNYGDIIVQTAGTKREFIMRDIADPERAKRKINELAGN